VNSDYELIARYLDGEPTADEETQLANWLAADVEHVRIFVREAHLHRQLRDIMLAQRYHAGAEALVKKAKRAGWLSNVGGFGRNVAGRFPFFPSDAFRRARLPIAACLALLIIGVVWLFGATVGQPALAEIHGEGLSILRAGQPLPISAGMLLRTGDVLRTPPDVTAVVGFSSEATRLTVLPGTEVKLAEMSRGKHFELRAGKLEASVARQRPFHPMTLITSQAEARVIGTRFSLLASNNATRLDVFEGNVRLTRLADGAAVQVGKGRYAVVAGKTELSALPFTGTILRQWWSGVQGHSVLDFRNDPRYPNHPDGSELARGMELQSIMTNQLGVRFCGYLHPPVTGEYEFWLSGATSAKLFMSPTENPADEVAVAFITEPSRNMDRPRYQTAPSAWAPPVPLVAGRRYFIEALVFVDKGEGFLSIAWKRDGQSREPLAAEFLSPYIPK
jgi:hypothetical protein